VKAEKPNRAMAAKPLRATPFTALQPSQSNQQESGQSTCYQTGQFYLLPTLDIGARQGSCRLIYAANC
jgi:hypothetical protein